MTMCILRMDLLRAGLLGMPAVGAAGFVAIRPHIAGAGVSVTVVATIASAMSVMPIVAVMAIICRRCVGRPSCVRRLPQVRRRMHASGLAGALATLHLGRLATGLCRRGGTL